MDEVLKKARKRIQNAKTAEEEENAEDEMMVERDRLAFERSRYITPGCCEPMRRTRAIVVMVDDAGKNPYWYLCLASNSGRGFSDMGLFADERAWFDAQYKAGTREPFVPAPSCCMFCCKELPAIVKKAKPPRPLHKDDDGHCATCEERVCNCACWPPWAAYETAAGGL